MKFFALLIVLALNLSACGDLEEMISGEKEEESEADEDKSSQPDVADDSTDKKLDPIVEEPIVPDPCDVALTVFESQLKVAINLSCASSSCHAMSTNKLVLEQDAASQAQNRANFFAMVSAWNWASGTEVYNYLIDDNAHAGGDQSPVITLTNLEEWIKAEDACVR